MTPFRHTLEGINQDCESCIRHNKLKLCKLKENHVINTNLTKNTEILDVKNPKSRFQNFDTAFDAVIGVANFSNPA